MEIDIEPLREAFIKFANELYKVIVQFVSNCWEQIKELVEKYMEYKLYHAKRPVYGYVKHRVMKSQVFNRKPMLIRARTTC
ncbi:hypothetical protein bcere0016_54370 [Bacillus cereus 95/8201]|uniref:hypothetical protein n=1 Tax=Bacillus cereus group TaxID=86661 RepID=UPI0001A08CEB|nr:hypothetical protein [Bacillus cereus]AJH60093.1 hypothetical protein BG11_5817 [Bacillus cereus]AJK31959.1 hypothetical protein BF33_5780 [Bacillus cereus]EEL13979.1 hypothetical protein bcere0016_54370 [Bacillus cereus 95/8201]KWU56852.1 hypothetical protein AWW71_20415 [Bacillus cereus]QKH64065.1 hypothetical protein FOC75_00095 [Bacillus cereus]